MFIGAVSARSRPLLGIPAQFASAIARFVAVFCGAVNCPMASIILSVEALFGSGTNCCTRLPRRHNMLSLKGYFDATAVRRSCTQKHAAKPATRKKNRLDLRPVDTRNIRFLKRSFAASKSEEIRQYARRLCPCRNKKKSQLQNCAAPKNDGGKDARSRRGGAGIPSRRQDYFSSVLAPPFWRVSSYVSRPLGGFFFLMLHSNFFRLAGKPTKNSRRR